MLDCKGKCIIFVSKVAVSATQSHPTEFGSEPLNLFMLKSTNERAPKNENSCGGIVPYGRFDTSGCDVAAFVF